MLKPRKKTPNIEIDLVNGTQWDLSEQTPSQFTMIVFYRGLHCPVCKTTLEALQDYIPEFTKRGINVIAISSDNKERAVKAYEEWDMPDLPVGYNFAVEKAREWGLFISEGIKDEPKHFIEPGLFLVRPDGTLYSAHIQSIPFARPQFDDLLKGIDFVKENDYPARGEA